MKTLDLQNLSMQLSAALSMGDASHLHATATDVADQLAKLAGNVPVGEVVTFGPDLKEVSWAKGKMPPVGTQLFAG